MEYKYKNIPEMFWSRVKSSGNRPAYKFKKDGVWKEITWKEAGEIAKEITSGLIAIGINIGDKVSILSGTRWEWIVSDHGGLSAGCITIPIYPSNTAEQAGYILNDSESRVVIVENDSQLDKIIKTRNDLPKLEKAIVIEPSKKYSENWIITLDSLRALGKKNLASGEKRIQEIISGVKPNEDATYVYTSGTTGPPKGVMQSHKNHIAMVSNLNKVLNISERDTELLFLPLAHSFARCIEFDHILVGHTLAFAESIEKVVDNMKEVKPTLMGSVPRIFEKAHTAIISKGQAGSQLKVKIFNWALSIGREVSKLMQERKPIPIGLSIKKAIAHKLVFSKLHETFGGRLRFFISGGAPLAQELAEFFHSAGILVLEGYGLTETCPATHINQINNYRFGTVGKAIPNVEVKIAPDGEILVKGDNIAKGYFKKEADTKEAWGVDGWFHTGDIGVIDKDGFLKITDRKKDLIVTAGGKNVAPQNIENLLKTDRYISQAMVYGDKRPFLTALITLDETEIKKFADKKGLKHDGVKDLVNNPEVVKLIEERVKEKNLSLASYETVKKFKILPKDFTQEDNELTPTLKVKRKVVVEKYRDIIDSMYK